MNESEVPTAMRALQATEYGPPSVFQYAETISPTITSPTQMIVRVFAAGINPIDWKIRRGIFSAVKGLKFPAILGTDFSGTIVAIGSKVTKYNIGDDIFGLAGNSFSGTGSYAEYILVDALKGTIAKKPSTMTHIEASGVGLCSLTAWDGLITSGNLPTGESAKKLNTKVLIIGASGGVGTFAVQIAKKINQAHVTAICSGKNASIVEILGADHLVDYKTQDFSEALKSERETFDLVLDLIGGEDNYTKSIALLKKQGVFVTAVGPDETIGEQKLGISKLLSVVGTSLWRKASSLRGYRSILGLPFEDFAKLVPYLERREIVTLVSQVFELKDGAIAHEASETCRAVGKIILKID
ncbi:hypothetical protein G9A89_002291 [Geosiphon pyriformis]|nr:hypothetical protein G9A89_002291 [Geosiphon pyriformis]